MSANGPNVQAQALGDLLFCYLAIGHEHKLPDSHPVVRNGNGVTGLPLPRHFPGNANRVLKIIGGVKYVFGALADNVELRHIGLSLCCWALSPRRLHRRSVNVYPQVVAGG